jgi:hypothetical protein
MKKFKLNYFAFSLIIAMIASCATEGALLDDDGSKTDATSEISNEGIIDDEYFFEGQKITDEKTIEELLNHSYGTVVIDHKAYIVNSEEEHDAIAFSGNDERNQNKAPRGSKLGIVFFAKGFNKTNKHSYYALWHAGEFYSVADTEFSGHIGLANGKGLNNKKRHIVRVSQILSLPNRINVVNTNNRKATVTFFLENPKANIKTKSVSYVLGPKSSKSILSNSASFNVQANGAGGYVGWRAYANLVRLN